jgi:hypothetical protein
LFIPPSSVEFFRQDVHAGISLEQAAKPENLNFCILYLYKLCLNSARQKSWKKEKRAGQL